MKRYICFQLQTSEPRIRIDISAMSRRVAASPSSRGRSRGRSRVRSQRRQKCFEDLFSDQQRVAKLRKQVQQQYPKKKVDELVAWLGDARVLCDAGKTLLELQSWSPDFMTDPDFSEMRSKLFESREDLLRRADFPQHVKENAASLDEFLLGQDGVLLVTEEVRRWIVMLPKTSTKPGSLACRRQRGTPQQWCAPSKNFFRRAPRLFWVRTHRRLKA